MSTFKGFRKELNSLGLLQESDVVENEFYESGRTFRVNIFPTFLSKFYWIY